MAESKSDQIGISGLPLSPLFERAYFHRDTVTAVVSSRVKGVVVSLSEDGVAKFWKKAFVLFDFAKQLKLHSGAVDSAVLSSDHNRLITCRQQETSLKVVDLNLFEVQAILKVDFQPLILLPFPSPAGQDQLLAFSTDSELIQLSENHQTKKFGRRIRAAVALTPFRAVVSVDEEGFLEMVDADTLKFVTPAVNKVAFNSKFETDFFEYQKSRSGVPVSIGASGSGGLLWVLTDAAQLATFTVRSGKLLGLVDLSAETFLDGFKGPFAPEKQMGSKRGRLIEDWMAGFKKHNRQLVGCDFDEREGHVVVPTPLGLAAISLGSGEAVGLAGALEKGELFLGACVYQGPKMSDSKGVIGQGGLTSQRQEADPLILGWSLRKSRFCAFSNRTPDPDSKRGEHEEEAHRKEAQRFQDSSASQTKRMATQAIIATSLGDIHVRLFPEFAPKAVENFVTHAVNGYYDNTLIHRVVKGYIQGGDPNNDGTGGESIWGGKFEDEFSPELTHDKPFALCMANSGPNTNGSQFFLTTIPSPWLNKRHTIFGRAFKGTEVVTEIEGLKTDNFEKPLMDVRVLRITPL